jgi:hypothetical protein
VERVLEDSWRFCELQMGEERKKWDAAYLLVAWTRGWEESEVERDRLNPSWSPSKKYVGRSEVLASWRSSR